MQIRDELKFFTLVGKMREDFVPPCWLVIGAIVICGIDRRRYVVKKIGHACGYRIGFVAARAFVPVTLQRLAPPFFKHGKVCDWSWLRPEVAPLP